MPTSEPQVSLALSEAKKRLEESPFHLLTRKPFTIPFTEEEIKELDKTYNQIMFGRDPQCQS
jgi:hypothetical protein